MTSQISTQMKYIKQSLLLLGMLLVLTLGLGACQPDAHKDIIENGTLKIELSMPEPARVKGAKGTIGYFWNPEHTLFLQVSQEGSAPQQLSLKPVRIQSEGIIAYFEVPLKSKDFDLEKPFTLMGAVGKGDSHQLATYGGVVSKPNEFGGLLPYDLLSEVPIPLLLDDEKVSLEKGKEQLSLTLSPLGKIMLLEWHNASATTIVPQAVALKAGQAIFSPAEQQYDAFKKGFTKPFSETSKTLHAEKVEALSPDFAIQYFYWLPVEEFPSDLELSLDYLIEGRDEVQRLTTQLSQPKGEATYFSLSIQEDGTLIVSNEQKNLKADISGGGDPDFSMDDILFWVGEGAKRAALVIEWHDGKTPDALVWGYRFDGEKTGFDMLYDVVAADPRLSIILGEQWGGYTLGAIGYQFTETKPRAHILLDGKPLDNNGKGVTKGVPKNYDKYTFSDIKAHWLAGFYTNGYWVYYTKDHRLDSFSYSNVVCSGRDLEDGAWDGWSFQHGMESLAGNPLGHKFVAAPLPETK